MKGKKYIVPVLILMLLVGSFSGIKNCVYAKGKELYYEDAKDLVKTVERTHVFFEAETVPSGYQKEKKNYLAQTKKKMTKEEFKYQSCKYLTSLKDGHTAIQSDENYYLDMKVKAQKGSLYLLTEDGKQKNRIVSIGRKPVKEILKTIDQYFAASNKIERKCNYEKYSRSQSFLRYLGCKGKNCVKIKIQKNKKEIEKSVKYKKTSNEMDWDNKNPMKVFLKKDVLYIDLNTCNLEEATFNEYNEKVKKYLDQGIKKVIIDVRDNTGGNAYYCETLLEDLGMKCPTYGMLYRHSPLTVMERWDNTTKGLDRDKADLSTASRNEKIKLVVLTNAKTYSAATMLAVEVQDGHLGTVIGRTSSCAPSFSADTVWYCMDKSELQLSISTSILLRPDQKANQKEIIPDVVTKPTDDVKTAMEYLEKK